MKKVLQSFVIVAALLSATVNSFATDFVVPAFSGDVFDICDPGLWEGGVAPSSADRILIKRSVPYLTASQDITLQRIQVQSSSVGATNIFRLPAGRKITLSSGGFDSYYSKAHFTLDGGIWSMTSDLKCAAGSAGYNSTIILTNGVEVIAQNVSAGSGARNGTFIMTGGSRATISSPILFGTSVDSYFRIDDGSVITGTGDFVICGSNCTNCLLEVDGEGTVVQGDHAFRSHRAGSSGNLAVVSNGAVLDFSGQATRIGESTSSSNTLVITSGAKAYLGDLTVNYDSLSFANRLVVSDGALLECRSKSTGLPDEPITVGGLGGSEVIISNATVKCSRVCLGASTNNRLVVTGPEAKIYSSIDEDSNFEFFGAGSGNEVIFDDYAFVGFTNHFQFASYTVGSGSGSNTVHIKNGSTLQVKNCWLGTPHGGNKLCVSSGGTFSLLDSALENKTLTVFSVYAEDSAVILSNGVVSAFGNNVNIAFGKDFNYAGVFAESPRTRFEVTGTNSCMQATGSISFENQAIISFDVPSGGYVTAPIKSNRLTIGEDCTINVACTAFRKGLDRRTKLVLAETEEGVSVPDAVLEAANAALAGTKACLRISADGRQLVLSVGADKGFSMLLR